jgi:hypothetical protein
MTLISTFSLVPPDCGTASASMQLDSTDLSVIIPVKNNPGGLRRLLGACLEIFSPQQCPAEILIVDNLSSPAVDLAWATSWGLPVKVLVCTRPGPAAARNLGARTAKGSWLLFLDSDCQPTPTLFSGYQHALCGAIAYAGVVRAAGTALISRYYDAQNILNPPPLWDQHGVERPAYLITANALIWRTALLEVGGFDERFRLASGEDIDLAMRLWAVGPLAYAPEAQVLHHFEDGLLPFVQRFVRYGRGNRLLAQRYHANLAPRPFAPAIPSLPNWLLARLQYAALWWGYQTTGRRWSQSLLSSGAPPQNKHAPTSHSSIHSPQGEPPTDRAAVGIFIDADHQSPAHLPMIQQIASRYGALAACRVYRAAPSRKWREACARSNAELTVTPPKGTDVLLAMEAEALAHTSGIQVFVLATNDGDFAPVAQRLRQYGAVIGLGSEIAAQQFQQACTHFLVLPAAHDSGERLHLFHLDKPRSAATTHDGATPQNRAE